MSKDFSIPTTGPVVDLLKKHSKTLTDGVTEVLVRESYEGNKLTAGEISNRLYPKVVNKSTIRSWNASDVKHEIQRLKCSEAAAFIKEENCLDGQTRYAIEIGVDSHIQMFGKLSKATWEYK
jgi:hypothetical protein